MRTTVSISQPLLNSARRRAAERGVNLSRVVEDALRSYLGAADQSAPAGTIHTGGRLVNPGPDLDRNTSDPGD